MAAASPVETCIAQCWEGPDTAASCPQCRETVQQRNLRPNRQLANVLEIAKRLSFQAVKGAGGGEVCGEHQEALKLFCEEDQTPICVVCDRSRAHRAHTVVPIQEAAQEYKEKIQAHLKTLREEREKLLVLKERSLERREAGSIWCEKGKFQQPEEISPEQEERVSDFSQKTIVLMETLRKFKDPIPRQAWRPLRSHWQLEHIKHHTHYPAVYAAPEPGRAISGEEATSAR
ncbi:E3 ubiquitin-protein ligase TRIM39-like [Lepidochelys kempii]|uniref:E3 ubiquitin-protein ligase TRIM39-like n=1 Tax=Lepidochelys kempii TaxID=8472 RepID=UPI003C6EDE32